MDYDLGFFDNEVNRVEPAGENPFSPKVLPYRYSAVIMLRLFGPSAFGQFPESK
jgi:hypothetical protein